MARVAVCILSFNGHAQRVCSAMAEGARALGDKVSVFNDQHYALSKRNEVDNYDAIIFWGYVETMQRIMSDFNVAGKPAVYLDLAYWNRGDHFKVSIGSRHPTAYFQKVKHDDKRRPKETLDVKPWHETGYVLVAGMGPKAAWAEKQEPVESWERRAIETLKKATDRTIIYRPKPSQSYGHPIPGTKLDVTTPIARALTRSWAVVTHHSNVGVDGLILGVPVFTMQGVAVPMGLQDLDKIESPRYPDDREQWLNDVAYTQWSLDEMKAGTCWRHLKDENLVP